jgi:hypothetical protein
MFNMITVFVDDRPLSLPSRFSSGDIMNDIAAEVLNVIQLRRIKAKLRYLLSHGEVLEDGLQEKLLELLKVDLVPYPTLDDEDADDDPILAEALAIAKDLITKRMAQEGLPPPKGLDLHAKALVDGMPSLMERARLRVEARYLAAKTALEGM